MPDAIDADVIATGAASWVANLVTIGKLQDENEVLRLNLQVAMQQVSLYRAELTTQRRSSGRSGRWHGR